MFVRVAFDPGPTYQQRVHQYDMETDDGLPDEAVICKVQTPIIQIIDVAVWDCPDPRHPRRGDGTWRTIHGTMP